LGCGVFGYVGLDDETLLKHMAEVLNHRGPDETGSYIDRGVGLGSTRLSIIDLETGKQPICNEEGDVWTVSNGEIYNFVELRRELEVLGHRFHTESDTEVIAHGYEQWRTGCFHHLVGMFATAIWDAGTRQLLLARDRFGKKPLYYSASDGALVFGSEIKAVLRSPSVTRYIDYQALEDYLGLFYVPSPRTIFRDVRSLEPGNFLVFKNGKSEQRQYWDFRFSSDSNMTMDYAVEAIFKLLLESVKCRLRSDVPLGAFLSGGIDSSVVVALMSQLMESPAQTFTVAFEEASYDESRHARQLAEYCGTDHTEVELRPDAIRLLPKLVWHFDEPFADSSCIPTFYVSEASRKSVKVALSGDGGDEMFMGYPWFDDPPAYNYYKLVPLRLRKPLLGAIAGLPGDSRVVTLARKAKEKGYDNQTAIERYLLRIIHFRGEQARSVLLDGTTRGSRPGDARGYVASYFRKSNSRDFYDEVDYVTVKTYLPEDILVKVDRMSMAVSLEVRCPFLDHRLAEFLGRVPSFMKVRRGSYKHLLKRMAIKHELLPSGILRREKRGFGVPIDYWFKGEWKEVSKQLIGEASGDKGLRSIIRAEEVAKLAKRPFQNADKLFALMMLVLWFKMYIDSDSKQPSLNISDYI
jgi:asparagine synthase (glutamine-hydrolysing)